MIQSTIGNIVESLGLHWVSLAVVVFIFVAATADTASNFFKKLFRK